MAKRLPTSGFTLVEVLLVLWIWMGIALLGIQFQPQRLVFEANMSRLATHIEQAGLVAINEKNSQVVEIFAQGYRWNLVEITFPSNYECSMHELVFLPNGNLRAPVVITCSVGSLSQTLRFSLGTGGQYEAR
ncbi:MAG: hypothetical protein ACRCZJ_09680 [Erysipelotrichaceae bacterium]